MFNYKTFEELQAKLNALGVSLPFSDDLSVLSEKYVCPEFTLANRFAIHPLEGCDGTADGSPDEQTKRRYVNFAQSGASLIWYEATAIDQNGRANPRQLMITEANLDNFKAQVDEIKETTMKEHGFEPIVIMQATHSGRYSKPTGKPDPIIAYNNPIFEKNMPIDPSRIISDDELKRLEGCMGHSAHLAELAGFDGVDVKCCHRYLASELLSAYTREGEYGGSFENRTRFYRNCVANARANVSKDFIVTSRLNIYDGFPYPYGFGVEDGKGLEPCLDEAVKLVGLLGMKLINITIGNPYVNPHVNRPADGLPYDAVEDPLTGVERMINCISKIQHTYPDMCVIGSGLSYLRQYMPQLCAGGIKNGDFAVAGLGRMAFAYPQMPADVMAGRDFNMKSTCLACGKCSELMRAGSITGCVVRDPFYTKLYMQYVKKA